MKRMVLLIGLLTAALLGNVQARECRGVTFPEHLQVNGNEAPALAGAIALERLWVVPM